MPEGSPRQPLWARQLEGPEVPDGWATGPPDFVGVGAQRCGTTWWFRGAIQWSASAPGSSMRASTTRILNLFPRDNVLILQHERCHAEPLAEMQRMQRFLGIA